MEDNGIFGNMMEAVNRQASGGKMFGYGFGVPTSKETNRDIICLQSNYK